MDHTDYLAARGELERLEAQLRDNPDDAGTLREMRDTLRREIAAFEDGARSTGRPPSGTSTPS
ncbi:MAG: hypothetical protein WCZ23_01870 [Rhodospirillaceae bacterium]